MGDGQNEDLRAQFGRRSFLDARRIGASVGRNTGCLEKSTRTRQRQSSTKGLAGRYFWWAGTQKSWLRRENVNKIPTRSTGGDRRGSAACYNRDTASLDRFQAQPKWEMSIEAGLAAGSLAVSRHDSHFKQGTQS